MIKLQPSSRVNYRNFGFNPSGHFVKDMVGWLFGYRNFLRRLQARDIMKALDLKTEDVVLDLGCGTGFLTLEVSKQCKKAIGVDVLESTTDIRIPKQLASKLYFEKVDDHLLPYEDNTFDKVLASAVIGVVEDYDLFLTEWKRVLKDGGKLIIINSEGRPPIKRAYERNDWKIRCLSRMFPASFPKSSDEWEKIMNAYFGNRLQKFPTYEELKSSLIEKGFDMHSFTNSPGKYAGLYISWVQFVTYLWKKRIPYVNRLIPKYYFFLAIDSLTKSKTDISYISVSINHK